MSPRVETAEILSFRLKVPLAELEGLPDQLGKELTLSVEADGPELVLTMDEADSYLRFRPIGPEAMLTEIFLCNDERALFFQRVLGALMVRYGGDLHVRLTWNTPERNSHGDFAEVKILRGSTTYPGLANALAALPPPLVGSQGGGDQPQGIGAAQAGGEPDLDPPLTEHEKEISDLLERARVDWDAYQKLKSKAKS